ncbi:hypothetical protein PY092_15075 [Muricauda sp. 334s03]|uniref:Integrase catalytic domain-containing protein n=1 Tax=Flagellimonas yonaguniensis TaxID=3031325 RepID=A0ABT5Y212_9FLAO|nr:hypothetical protein [[Muricauda] yonaguniensis]MDF0717485.1 hypothetical protein [[Muricauda] yonaguniensis]
MGPSFLESKPPQGKAHKTYPHLLRNLTIERSNQVWATIPMQQGYLYLVAIIDLHSCYVLNWSLSNSMDVQWCREILEGPSVSTGY